MKDLCCYYVIAVMIMCLLSAGISIALVGTEKTTKYTNFHVFVNITMFIIGMICVYFSK